jgi:hypothetical protein
VVPKAHRSRVYLPGLRVAATILVDGFVAGAWTTELVKGTARLVVTPFEPFSPKVRAEATEEGDRLVRFIEPETTAYEVGFAD